MSGDKLNLSRTLSPIHDTSVSSLPVAPSPQSSMPHNSRRRCSSGHPSTVGQGAVQALVGRTLLTVPAVVHRNARSAPTSPETQRKMLPQFAGSANNLDRLGNHTKSTFEKQASSPELLKLQAKSVSRVSMQCNNSVRKVNGRIKLAMFLCPGCKRPVASALDVHDASPRFSKPNIKFHKCFKDAPSTEIAFDCFSCALVTDLLLQGHLFISDNWFCFYSKILGREKQIEIPVGKVRSITRKKTAFFIPNAIKVTTDDGKYLFGSLISRDAAFKLMVYVWKNFDSSAVADPDQNDSDENSLDISPDGVHAADHGVPLPFPDLPADTVSTDTLSEEGSEVASTADTSLPICLNGRPPLVEKSASSTQTRDEIDFSENGNLGWRRQFYRRVKNCIKFDYDKERVLTLTRSYINTSTLVAICCALVVVLLISAVILSYKILSLEARLSGNTPYQNEQFNLYSEMYALNDKVHTANVQHMNSVIQAQLMALRKMQDNLKILASAAMIPPESCDRSHEET